MLLYLTLGYQIADLNL